MSKFTPTVNMYRVRELTGARRQLVQALSELPTGSTDLQAKYSRTIEAIDAELDEMLGAHSEVKNAIANSYQQEEIRGSGADSQRQIAQGFGCIAIAAIVGVLTFQAARDGGSYVVLWGAMVFGAILIVKGLISKVG